MPFAPGEGNIPILSERCHDVKWDVNRPDKEICGRQTTDEIIRGLVEFVIEDHNSYNEDVPKHAADANNDQHNDLYVNFNVVPHHWRW